MCQAQPAVPPLQLPRRCCAEQEVGFNASLPGSSGVVLAELACGRDMALRASKGCRTGPAAALCLRQRCPRAPVGVGVILQEGVRRHHLLVPLLPGIMVLSCQGGVCDLSLVKDDGWRRHSWSPAVNRFVPEVQEKRVFRVSLKCCGSCMCFPLGR